MFSLFHKDRKNIMNLSKVSNNFMQRVTTNYLKNLRITRLPNLVKRTVKTSPKRVNNIAVEDLVLESRELGNDAVDSMINNIIRIDEVKNTLSKTMEKEPDYSSHKQDQSIDLDNGIETVQTNIDNINQAEENIEDLATVTDSMVQDNADTPSGWGNNIAFFNVPHKHSDTENLSSVQTYTLKNDLFKSTYEAKPENKIIEAVRNSDIQPFDYNIGREPPTTDFYFIKNIDVHLNGKDLSESSSTSDIFESEIYKEKKVHMEKLWEI
jgi:hypothetical protein